MFIQGIRNKIYIILLLTLGILVSLDFFHPGLPITHDGIDHVARIANFYENLKEGNIIPRWAGNLNWGYGHPILMFLYPLPSYLASIFHFIGINLIDSVKIVFFLGLVLSGLTMYFWLSEFLDPLCSFLGGVIYMVTPYRFIELYVRGDIGENLAFIFIPLVCFFISRISKKDSVFNQNGFAISLALLILAHNAISLMFLPFIIFYAFFIFWFRKVKPLSLIVPFILGFMLSAFFWIPGFFEGKYTLRDIVTKNGYLDRFVDPKALFYGPWNYGGTGQFTVQLGIINWIGLLISPFLLLKKERISKKIFTISLIIFTLIGIFLMLDQSSFIWARMKLLQNFQFPWRFLAITVFATAALVPLVISYVPAKIKVYFVFVVVISALFLTKDYWHPKGFIQRPDSFFTSIYRGTTDTGESAPIWSVRFMEHSFDKPLEVISGKAAIMQDKRTITDHVYFVTASTKARLRENTLYFPGWEISVDGKITPVEYQDPSNRGLMTFFVNPGRHIIEAKFGETRLRWIADGASILGLLIIVRTGVKKIL